MLQKASPQQQRTSVSSIADSLHTLGCMMSSEILKTSIKTSASVLSTDFCPWANRWVYWLKNPFWLLVLAVVGSALCGVFLNPMIFGLTALLLVVTLVGAALPWLAIRKVSCRVMFDVKRAQFGEPALVRLRIQNRSWFPVWGLSLVDGFTNSTSNNAAADSDDGIAFGRIRGRATIEYTWPFIAKRRGLYPFKQEARVETSFPFGLFRARKPAKVSGRLIVWPETTDLAGLPEAAESEMIEEQFSDRREGEFGDVLGTRPFRHGDSLRRVHWAQTARQQCLIVTERQAPVTTVARVVLDLSQESHPEETRQQSVEQCIRVAASVCESLHNQHCRVELQIGNDLYVSDQNTTGLHRIMDALSLCEVSSESGTAVNDANSQRNRRGILELKVTTEHGKQTGNNNQIVVTTDRNTDSLNRKNWLQLASDAPLDQLSDLWKRSVSCSR